MRECSGRIMIEALERVPQSVQKSRLLVGVFHSCLEERVLRFLARRDGLFSVRTILR
jgi:hypothetical protein